jgi:fructose-specific phosphotransferase system IIC component
LESRFWQAIGVFAILGGLAALTLTGPVRAATLLFLAGLAAKTWIALLQHRQRERENSGEPVPTVRVED